MTQLDQVSCNNRLNIFRQNQILSPIICIILSYFVFLEDQSSLHNSAVLLVAALCFCLLFVFSFNLDKKTWLYIVSCWLTLFLIGYFLTAYALLSSPALPWLCCVPSLLVFFLDGKTLKLTAMLVFSFLFYLLYHSLNAEFTVKFASTQRDRLLLISAICALCYAFFLSFALWNANKRLTNHLSIQSEIDFLTGTLNRRAFSQHLDRRAPSHQRPKAGIGVTMLDIDNFKQINDSYGHQVGDEVIKMVGKTIQRALREDDIVARYGGEEFVILYENTLPEEMNLINQRILKCVREATLEYDHSDINVTLSAGSIFRQHKEVNNVYQLINQADKKLYQAKRAGKNCLVTN